MRSGQRRESSKSTKCIAKEDSITANKKEQRKMIKGLKWQTSHPTDHGLKQQTTETARQL